MDTTIISRLRPYDVQIGTPERRTVYQVSAANPLLALDFILTRLRRAGYQPPIRSLVIRPRADG